MVEAQSTTTFADTVSVFLVRRSMNSAPVAFPVLESTVIFFTMASVRMVSRPACFAASKGKDTRLRFGAAYLHETTERSGHLASTFALNDCSAAVNLGLLG